MVPGTWFGYFYQLQKIRQPTCNLFGTGAVSTAGVTLKQKERHATLPLTAEAR